MLVDGIGGCQVYGDIDAGNVKIPGLNT